MTGPHRRPWIVAPLLLAAACSRAAYTGRLEGARVGDEEDLALAERAVAQYRLRVRPSTDQAATTRAARVAQAILDAARTGPAGEHAGRLAWQMVVAESPNATVATFANGTIFVDAGLVRTMPTDDALGAALGQAVARVLLWYGAESNGRRTARGMLATFTGMRPSSRPMNESEKERTEEADLAGLVLAVEAGYDPELAVAMFDHLGLKERGEQVRERLPELRELRATGKTARP